MSPHPGLHPFKYYRACSLSLVPSRMLTEVNHHLPIGSVDAACPQRVTVSLKAVPCPGTHSERWPISFCKLCFFTCPFPSTNLNSVFNLLAKYTQRVSWLKYRLAQFRDLNSRGSSLNSPWPPWPAEEHRGYRAGSTLPRFEG